VYGGSILNLGRKRTAVDNKHLALTTLLSVPAWKGWLGVKVLKKTD